jgi:hypothetical protein
MHTRVRELGVLASSIVGLSLHVVVHAPERGASESVIVETAQRRVDSLVLERTTCYGTCGAYRVSISATGRIQFQSRNPGDTATASDSVAPKVLPRLVTRAERAGFFKLPARIADDRKICVDRATDHPTVTVSIYGSDGRHVVEDYQGCFRASDHSVVGPLVRLRAFETAVDSALGTERWVRPSRGG